MTRQPDPVNYARPGTLEVTLRIDTDNMAALAKVLDRHIDRFINMDANSDIVTITRIYGVTSRCVSDDAAESPAKNPREGDGDA